MSALIVLGPIYLLEVLKMIRNVKTLVEFLTVGLVLTFVSLSPAQAEPTLDTSSAQQRGCFQMISEDGGLTVKECLTQTSTAAGKVVALPSLPDSMIQMIGAELQWMPQLMPRWNQMGQTSGHYSRFAGLDSAELSKLAEHPFALHVDGTPGFVAFRLELENHMVQTIEGELSVAGDGFLTMTYRDAEQRSVRFEQNFPTQGYADNPADKNSSFYMGCYIDTPAWDTYRPNTCYRLWGQQSSVAVFKVFLPYTPQSIVWVTPSSSCSATTCSAPISPGQTVYGYAYWVINNTPTGPVGATAIYLDEPGL